MRNVVCYILVAVIVLAVASAPVFAISDSLEVLAYPKEKIEGFLQNVGLRVIHLEPESHPIKCFDVNVGGMIALGFDNANMICVYSPEGEYLYGYSFDCSGDYSLIWDEENVCIYFVRSDVLITFNSEGNCVNFRKIAETSDNYRYIRNTFAQSRKQLGSVTYWLEKDIPIANGYARLVAAEANGAPQILYDATAAHNAATILTIVLVVLFSSCVILPLARRYRKQ